MKLRITNLGGVKLALLSVFALFTACAVQAKTCVWSGAGELKNNRLEFFDPANWEGNETPEDGDSITLERKDAKNIWINKTGYTFENLYCESAYGGDFSGGSFKLSGTESVFKASGVSPYFGTSVEVLEGAKIKIDLDGIGFATASNSFSGKGEIDVVGSGADSLSLTISSNPNFHGTWNIYRRIWISGVVHGVRVDPFGADDCTVNVYGKNNEDATHVGNLAFGGAAEVSGTINAYHYAGISTTYASAGEDGIVTFNGNVTYTASASSTKCQLDISCSMANASARSGYIFRKDLICNSGNNPWMNIYTYSAGIYHFEVRGKFTPTLSGSNPFGIGLLGTLPAESQLAEVYLGDTLTVGHVYRLAPRSYNHYHTTRANILPTDVHGIWIGYSSRDPTTPDSYLDLHGYDQTVAAFRYNDNTKVYGFAVQSTGRPATLKVGNNETTAHLVPLLKGKVSIYGYALSSNNGAHSFTNVYETSGWIGTEKNTLVIEDTASFPNLGGIECTGAGSVLVRSGATFNSNMTLDVHGMTGNKVRIPTGKNLDVKHVFCENVDLPAGVYCRTGAGIEDATEVAWLNKASSDTDEMKGTVTVAEHDPVWIWTGNGSSSSFTDGANWGVNAAPDLTNARLTLNLKNAAGKATAVPLNGTIAPAGAFNCGDFSKDGAVVTFGGSGTLVLGDAGAAATNDLKMVFTESTSFTWNGTGTLYLTGKSTSTGTLTVNSGKVILDYAGWTGRVVVAAGAELVVNTNCGSDVFGESEDNASEMALDGKLTLGNEIAATVHALSVRGSYVRGLKTYGSSESGAARVDDLHFGGSGTITSLLKCGMTLIFK